MADNRAEELENIFVVNEGVLILPINNQNEKVGNINISFSKVNEQNFVLMGWVYKCGPGYLSVPNTESDVYMPKEDKFEYLAIDVKEGDRVYYHKSNQIPITIGSTEYHLVKYHHLLVIDRMK